MFTQANNAYLMSRWTTQNLKKEIVTSLFNGTFESYRTLECKIYRYYQGYHLRKCLSSWCLHIATCLNQTSQWETLCYKKFAWFRSSRFDISAVDEGLNTSYVRNIHVKYCGRTYPDSDTVRFKFAIKTTGFRCQAEKTNNGR